MRTGRAQDPHVQLMRKRNVGCEAPLAGQERRVREPQYRSPDEFPLYRSCWIRACLHVTLRPTRRQPEPAMIELYAMRSPNVVKIYISLEEMGLRYAVLRSTSLARSSSSPNSCSSTRTPSYRSSPIMTGRGKPYTLFESRAILLYLAEKTRQFLPQGSGRKVRRDPVDDGADDLSRYDVRPIRTLHAFRTRSRRGAGEDDGVRQGRQRRQ